MARAWDAELEVITVGVPTDTQLDGVLAGLHDLAPAMSVDASTRSVTLLLTTHQMTSPPLRAAYYVIELSRLAFLVAGCQIDHINLIEWRPTGARL